MDRKKILVDIYLANNLGDDLFLDHLANAFPDLDFIPFHPGKNYSDFYKNYQNIQQFPYSIFDKIKSKLGSSKLTNYSELSKTYDGLLFLGGGIFREESYWKSVYEYRSQITKAFKNQEKKVYFMGCNFGPFQSKEFEEKHRQLFQLSDGISFRDKVSYQLFSDLNQVSYAPDLLWSYPLSQVTKREKTLGISVIDSKHKQGLELYYDDYIQAHKKLCEKYLEDGYRVIIFSFCEKEGDLSVAKEIAQSNPKIEIENYSQNISSYLEKIGSCSHFIGARFHAIILAMKFQIPVIPVIYGDKTENLLKDLAYPHSTIYLKNISDLINSKFYILPIGRLEELSNESKKHLAINF